LLPLATKDNEQLTQQRGPSKERKHEKSIGLPGKVSADASIAKRRRLGSSISTYLSSQTWGGFNS